MTVTISRLYDRYEDAERAVRDLEAAGISHGDISIVANNADGRYGKGNNAATGAGIGAVVVGAAGLLAGLGLLAIPGIGPVVAAGWLVSTGAGAVAGAAAGGIVGALTSAGVSKEDAHVYAEGVRRGGTLVSARVPDTERSRYEQILNRSSVNIAERGASYRQAGWTGFSDDAPAYKPDPARSSEANTTLR
ncbi:MAG TPA: hypothetical protein VII49_13455 [Rhizomicrobium sp.]